MEKLGRGDESLLEVTHDMIAARAYERFAQRGFQHGSDVEDWLVAENELRGESTPERSHKAATSRSRAPVRANKSTRR